MSKAVKRMVRKKLLGNTNDKKVMFANKITHKDST